MIITTTMQIEGQPIKEYKGIVEGRNFVKDFFSSIRDVVGGRSNSYESSLASAREESLKEMSKRAKAMGANAIVGVSVSYETLGETNGMLMEIGRAHV